MQRAAEQMIDRRHDWRALTETRRTRIQKAKGCDCCAKHHGRSADGSEGDIGDDDKSDSKTRDLTFANASPIKYECGPLRITNVAAVPGPIIEDEDVGRERKAARE